MIKVSASQKIFVCMVLRHQNNPSAALAFSLDKYQHVRIKFREIVYVCCAVNSRGCTNDNGMKTSLIIEQSAYIGVVQSNKKLPVVRSGRQRSDNALKCFRESLALAKDTHWIANGRGGVE